jgi:hypothetical protein
MLTRFGPSKKYEGLEWRKQNTEVITKYSIAE